MNTGIRYLINKPDVVHETFDDEIVLINLANGNYFTIDKIGAFIWSGIENGATVTEIIDKLTRQHEDSHEKITIGVKQFINELHNESLITPCEQTDIENIAESNALEEPSSILDGLKFEAPVLHKFTDMQELLLLDPIHEVDEMGWPHTKTNLPDKNK